MKIYFGIWGDVKRLSIGSLSGQLWARVEPYRPAPDACRYCAGPVHFRRLELDRVRQGGNSGHTRASFPVTDDTDSLAESGVRQALDLLTVDE